MSQGVACAALRNVWLMCKFAKCVLRYTCTAVLQCGCSASVQNVSLLVL